MILKTMKIIMIIPILIDSPIMFDNGHRYVDDYDARVANYA